MRRFVCVHVYDARARACARVCCVFGARFCMRFLARVCVGVVVCGRPCTRACVPKRTPDVRPRPRPRAPHLLPGTPAAAARRRSSFPGSSPHAGCAPPRRAARGAAPPAIHEGVAEGRGAVRRCVRVSDTVRACLCVCVCSFGSVRCACARVGLRTRARARARDCFCACVCERFTWCALRTCPSSDATHACDGNVRARSLAISRATRLRGAAPSTGADVDVVAADAALAASSCRVCVWVRVGVGACVHVCVRVRA